MKSNSKLLLLGYAIASFVGFFGTNPAQGVLLLDEHWTDPSFADGTWDNGDNGWEVTKVGASSSASIFTSNPDYAAELYSPFLGSGGGSVTVKHSFAPTSSGDVQFVWGASVTGSAGVFILYAQDGTVAKKLYVETVSGGYGAVIQDSDSPYNILVDSATGIEAHSTYPGRDQLFTTISWDVATQSVTAVGNNHLYQSITDSDSAGFGNAVTDIAAIEFVVRSYDSPNTRGGMYFFKHEGNGIVVNGTLVPEPASLALIGLGGLLMLRRRRN